MLSFLVFLLSVSQLQRYANGEISDTSHYNLNAIPQIDGLESNVPPSLVDYNQVDNEDEIPLVETGTDQTEVEFRQPISSVKIDYPRNAIILKFRKPYPHLDSDELERLKSLEANFMRFGKRAIENLSNANGIESDENEQPEKADKGRFERSSEKSDKNGKVGLRDSRGDNFMRFGRGSGKDYMRFGRDPPHDFMRFGRDLGSDYMRFGRNSAQDFMRFGRDPGRDYMRFGRTPAKDFMRFGRDPGRDYMRFGRAPAKDFMRFGRDPDQDYMRFGKSSAKDFIRFGRSPGDFMRFGRSPVKDFMRLGRTGFKGDRNFMRFSRPDNFMRFGRSDSSADTESSSNFMRFGRMSVNTEPSTNGIDEKDSNHTSSTRLLQKTDIKAAAKLLHETDPVYEESNPVDKAIQVLFSKHDAEQTGHRKSSEEDTSQEAEY